MEHMHCANDSEPMIHQLGISLFAAARHGNREAVAGLLLLLLVRGYVRRHQPASQPAGESSRVPTASARGRDPPRLRVQTPTARHAGAQHSVRCILGGLGTVAFCLPRCPGLIVINLLYKTASPAVAGRRPPT
jgi:hypothetical protein